MLKKIFAVVLLTVLIFPLAISEARADSIPNEVSVKLIQYNNNATTMNLSITGTYYLDNDPDFLLKGNYQVRINNNRIELFQGNNRVKTFTNSFEIRPVKYGSANRFAINDRSYLGAVKFTRENNAIVPINTLPMEDYLKGVVPGEMPASWGNNALEALKAQAVSARNYAFHHMNNSGGVLVDTVSNQKYEGYSRHHENTDRAVNETKGQVRTHSGTIFPAYYSSSNGGHTETNTGVWGTNPQAAGLAYLPAKSDPYDSKDNPNSRWEFSFKEVQIAASKLDGNPSSWWNDTREADHNHDAIKNVKTWINNQSDYRGKEIKLTRISDLSFSGTTQGKRKVNGSYRFDFIVKNQDGSYVMEDGKIKIHTLRSSSSTRASELRTIFGTAVMRSIYIDSVNLASNGTYTIKGRGFGHGVGMSQYGARGMALDGKSVNDILSFYYPNTSNSNYINDNVNSKLSGSTRYATSAEIAKYGWKSFDTVVIGRGDNPVDALTGSVLANQHDAPLLLVQTDKVPSEVMSLLRSQNIKNVYILGGEQAVSKKALDELKKVASNVERVRGPERYSTSVEVAKKIGGVNEVIITSGSSNSPDALSIASYAAMNGIPILFSEANSLPSSVQKYIESNNVKKATIIGGTVAVSANVENRLKQIVGNSNVSRISGPDRYATSTEIVKQLDLDPRNIFFARGEVFIDALPGSVLAAKNRAPIVLTQKDGVPSSVRSYINSEIQFVPHIHYLGGTGAISQKTRDDLQRIILR